MICALADPEIVGVVLRIAVNPQRLHGHALEQISGVPRLGRPYLCLSLHIRMHDSLRLRDPSRLKLVGYVMSRDVWCREVRLPFAMTSNAAPFLHFIRDLSNFVTRLSRSPDPLRTSCCDASKVSASPSNYNSVTTIVVLTTLPNYLARFLPCTLDREDGRRTKNGRSQIHQVRPQCALSASPVWWSDPTKRARMYTNRDL